MKNAPKQIVQQRFETREKLVDAIMELMGDDEKNDRTAAQLKSSKNAKLLRLYDVLGEVQQKFGSKDALIQSIAKNKFANGNPDAAYIEKLQKYTSKRLLDLHRQVS